DGIVKNWKNTKTSPAAELSKVLLKAQGNDSTAMQEALDKSVKECSKRARKQETDDDLTVVIVKLNQIGSLISSTNNLGKSWSWMLSAKIIHTVYEYIGSAHVSS